MMEMDQTTADLEGLLKVLSVATGKRFNSNSFKGRLRIQKTIYLLKSLGHPIARRYRYNMYLRGPYSPDLTKDYYKITARNIHPSSISIPREMELVIVEAMNNGDSFLEAAATILSLYKTNSSTANRTMIIRLARSIKPQLHHKYDAAWDYLERVDLI